MVLAFLLIFSQDGHDTSFCVQRLMEILGSRERWNQVRYVRFDFAVQSGAREISHHYHLWDKWTGRYRVEGTNRRQQAYQILFDNVHAKKGRVRIDGKVITADSLQRFLDYGYARFINDTYWLAMPWKLSDPGVHLDHAFDAGTCIIRMTFDKVGLTPGDTYWVVSDSSSGQLLGWKFKLEDGEEGDYDWMNWVEVDGLKFSQSKISRDQTTTIRTMGIKLFKELPDAAFVTFDATMPQ